MGNPVNTGLEIVIAEAIAAGLNQQERHVMSVRYREARHEYFRLVPAHEVTIEGMRAHCVEKARGYIRRHARYEQPKGDDAA